MSNTTSARVRDDGKVEVHLPVVNGSALTVTITRAEAEAAAHDPERARELLARWGHLAPRRTR